MKERKNVCLTDTKVESIKKLASEEVRSFSSMCEILINEALQARSKKAA